MNDSAYDISRLLGNGSSMPDDIFRFFVLNCPYAHSDKSGGSSVVGVDLADKGWKKHELHNLLDWVCNELNYKVKFYASSSINQTLEDARILKEFHQVRECAYLAIKNKINVQEDGSCSLRLKETYSTCLFRHIRNSFAHGNFYIFDSGRVVLLDESSSPNAPFESKRWTFGMCASLDMLERLKCLVLAGPSVVDKASRREAGNTGKTYRVTISREILLEEQGEQSS